MVQDVPRDFLDRAADPEGDFDDVPHADAEADYAVYLAEVEAARAPMNGVSLEHEFATDQHPAINMGWPYLHMIEEYARHNGHADVLRERIDGVIGVRTARRGPGPAG